MLPVKAIRLNGKHGRGNHAIIDPENYRTVVPYNWYALNANQQRGGQKYPVSRIWDQDPPRVMTMATLITGFAVNGYRNGNGLDCRRANLFELSSQQRTAKRRSVPGTSSRFKGVTWNKQRNLWQAQLGYRGKNLALGGYSDEVEAALVYDRKLIELYGPDAMTNERLGLFGKGKEEIIVDAHHRLCKNISR